MIDTLYKINSLENFFSFKQINSVPLKIETNVAEFNISDCKFIIIELDTYSNVTSLLNKTTQVIPYFFLKQGRKYYFSDFSTAYEQVEISLAGDKLQIRSVKKTIVYVGEIFII